MDAGKFGREKSDWNSLATPNSQIRKIDKPGISRKSAVRKVTDRINNLEFQRNLEDVMGKGIIDSIDFRI